MLCPQCDSILGGGRCQNCGWNTSQPWPAFRMVAGSSFPLKDRTLYPPAAELPAAHVAHVGAETVSMVEQNRAVADKLPTPPIIEPEPIAVPPAEPVAPTTAAATPKDPTIQ